MLVSEWILFYGSSRRLISGLREFFRRGGIIFRVIGCYWGIFSSCVVGVCRVRTCKWSSKVNVRPLCSEEWEFSLRIYSFFRYRRFIFFSPNIRSSSFGLFENYFCPPDQATNFRTSSNLTLSSETKAPSNIHFLPYLSPKLKTHPSENEAHVRVFSERTAPPSWFFVSPFECSTVTWCRWGRCPFGKTFG